MANIGYDDLPQYSWQANSSFIRSVGTPKSLMGAKNRFGLVSNIDSAGADEMGEGSVARAVTLHSTSQEILRRRYCNSPVRLMDH
jgi:hypothetical protein